MKRITFLALLLTGLLCSTAQADFFIDNFTILDDVGGGATSIGSNGITVEVTDSIGAGSSTVVNDVANQYEFRANNAGDSFVVSYDWSANVFNDLQSVSGNLLTQSPLNFFGDWTLTIDTGVGTPATFGPTISSILGTPIELDNATELTYTFTYNGGVNPLGFGIGTFGGVSGALFATPEPTAFMMLGMAGLIVASRRRRKS